MMVKKYICGICKKKGVEFISSRDGLRNHLKQEHFIFTSITNSRLPPKTADRSRKATKQDWWITEEVKQ